MRLKKSAADLLVFLAAKGGAARFVGETTVSLADALGVSQQTVSRWMIEMEKAGLLERGAAGHRLTKKAAAELQETYSLLSAAFGEKKSVRLEGVVERGFGDGAYYMSQKNYLKQFREKLGFAPFSGTVNVRLATAEDAAERAKLARANGAAIKGFREGGHVFGNATCFAATLTARGGKAAGAVIVPERSHYGSDVVEFISPKRLSKALSLRDGDRVAIEVALAPLPKGE